MRLERVTRDDVGAVPKAPSAPAAGVRPTDRGVNVGRPGGGVCRLCRLRRILPQVRIRNSRPQTGDCRTVKRHGRPNSVIRQTVTMDTTPYPEGFQHEDRMDCVSAGRERGASPWRTQFGRLERSPGADAADRPRVQGAQAAAISDRAGDQRRAADLRRGRPSARGGADGHRPIREGPAGIEFPLPLPRQAAAPVRG